MEKLLRPSEAAALLGVRVSTLYTWAARRQVPVQRVGRSLRFSPAALSKWLAAQARPPRSETDAEAAEQWRLAQAQELLDCHREGRVPRLDGDGLLVTRSAPGYAHAREMPAEKWRQTRGWLQRRGPR